MARARKALDRKSGLDAQPLSVYDVEIAATKKDHPVPFVAFTIDFQFNRKGKWVDPYADDDGDSDREAGSDDDSEYNSVKYVLRRHNKYVPKVSKLTPYILHMFESNEIQEKFLPIGSVLRKDNLFTMYKTWICDSLAIKKQKVEEALDTFDSSSVAGGILERYKAVEVPPPNFFEQFMAYKPTIQIDSEEEFLQAKLIAEHISLACAKWSGKGRNDTASGTAALAKDKAGSGTAFEDEEDTSPWEPCEDDDDDASSGTASVDDEHAGSGRPL